MKSVVIYTDGACSGNPGPGGWGAVLRHGDNRLEIQGGAADTTNNRMELTAVIEALGRLKEPCDVKLYSDSSYVIKAFTQGWIENWQRLNWVRKTEPIPNTDLWKKLLELTRKHRVEWNWVRGHADNEENNRCDELAREAIARMRKAGKA